MSSRVEKGKRWLKWVVILILISAAVKLLFAFGYHDTANRVALALVQIVGGSILFGGLAFALGWATGGSKSDGHASGASALPNQHDMTSRLYLNPASDVDPRFHRANHIIDAPATPTKERPSHTSEPTNVKTPTDKLAAAQPASAMPGPATEPFVLAPQSLDINEDAIYDRIGQELEDKKPDRATWTKAFAEANGDQNQAKATYTRLRFEKLLVQERNLVAARDVEIEEHAKKIAALGAKFRSGQQLHATEIEVLALAAGHDADILESAETQHGNTLLHLAAEAGLTRTAERLLGLGASATANNDNGKRPFEVCEYPNLVTILEKAAIAERNKLAASTKALLSLSATTSAAKFRNAVRTGDMSEISAALRQEPRLANIVESSGSTPLMIAVHEGYLGVLQLLLAYGADPNVANNHGQTAKSIAEKAGRAEIVLAIDSHKRDAAGGYELVPKGQCPNCKAVVPLAS